MDPMTTLTGPQIADEKLTGWAYLLGGLQTRIRTPDFAAGLAIVTAIGAAAEAMNHHPDLDLRYTHVDIRLSSHDVHGVSRRDITLARNISAIAADAGLDTECTGVSRLELALDSPAIGSVLPFWQAVLTMTGPSDAEAIEVVDPFGALPTLWFQRSGTEEPRQRWHYDLWIDPAQVQPRIEAALAAGGTLVSDEEAPKFWLLADPEGNQICLCTWEQRDPTS
jgi:4a-hydroxytetrahydrobiopterin dehydratase